jgi:polar amino acid transport system substrate-binding protein
MGGGNVRKIASIVLCLLLPVVTHVASAQVTLHISTGEFAPWSSETLKHKGFTSHVISEAFKLEGYDVEFTFYPWKRAYESAKSGEKFHATSYWYPSNERRKEFYYSEPLQSDRTVFFHLKSNPLADWKTLDDLKGKRIGATLGFTYTVEFWDAAKSKRLDVQEASSDDLNFKKLLKGRVDLVPSDPLVGQKILLETFGADVAGTVTFHPKPLVAPTGHLLFSKQLENGEDLVSTFNRGLAKLRESGQYAQFEADLIAGKYDQ